MPLRGRSTRVLGTQEAVIGDWNTVGGSPANSSSAGRGD